MNRLPPLNSLRCFEAVARRLSFKLAAEDLFVTQSAVSHQIKQLEEHLGCLLFMRKSKSLELTNHGARLLPAVSQAFNLILEATTELEDERRGITINTSTSFAMSWLMRRFHEFERIHPEIRVNIDAAPRETAAKVSTSIDLEVAYSVSEPDTPEMELLFRERLLPVCAHSRLAGTPLTLRELVSQRLLLNAPDAMDWKIWAKWQGIEPRVFQPALANAIKLPTDVSAIDMAVAGYGIALANLHYVEDKLASGLLTPATNVEPMILGGHYLRCQRVSLKGKTKHVVEWLKQEGALSEQRFTTQGFFCPAILNAGKSSKT